MNDEALPWFLARDSQFTYLEDDFVVVDFETSNLEKGSALNPDNRIVLACWTVVKGDTAVHKYHFGDEYSLYELVKDIQAARFCVAHHAKFEAQWLKRCGLDLTEVLLYDTMLGQWVLDGNVNKDRSLEGIAQARGLGGKGSLVSNLIHLGVCPSKIKPEWLLKYCQKDVQLCLNVFLEQRKELYIRQQLHLVHSRNLACACLADIEFNGMFLDPQRVEDEYNRTAKALQEVSDELEQLSPGVNWGSPKQLAVFLYEVMGFAEVRDFRGKPLRTATGARATGAEVLSKLKPADDRQARFLAAYKLFNKMDSLMSKNLAFFWKVVKEKSATFYGQFNQGVVTSHRLSASGRKIKFSDGKVHSVQFQNMPRQYKSLFCSGEEDWLISNADGAQLEFRVAADLGHDEVALKEIEGGVDIHSFTAQVLTEAGEPTTRQDAKASTFKPLYGGGRGSPAIEEYCNFFKDKYRGISSTQHSWTLQVLNDKYLTTPYGMMFFWPQVEMRKGYITHTTEIYNLPVQGFATGEIIPIALVHFWHRIKGKRILILNTIHDSIISKVHKDVVEEYEEIAKVALTYDVYRFLHEVYGYDFKVPLGVGIKTGKHWDESKVEKIWSVWPDGRESYKEKQ